MCTCSPYTSFNDRPHFHINGLLLSSLWFPGCCLRDEVRIWAQTPAPRALAVCLRVSSQPRECSLARLVFLPGLNSACAWGCVIRAALELYKKSLTVKTIVQTAWFQRCSTTACAAKADWTGVLERGRETSGLQHPVAAHLPLSLLLPLVSFVRMKGFEHQRQVVVS